VIFAGSLLYVLILIALMYLLIKVPGWVLRAATGHPRRRGGFVRSVIKGALLAVGVSTLGAGPTLLAATRGGPASRVAGSLLGSALGQGWLAAKRRSTPAPAAPYATPATAGPGGQLALPLGRLRRARRADTPAARAQAARADWAAYLKRTRIDSGATTPARTAARTRRGQQLALPLNDYWPEQQLIEGPGGQWMMKLPPGARKRPPRGGAPAPSETGAARTRPRPGTGARPGGRARQLALPLGEFWPEDRLVMRRDGQWMLPLPPGARRRPPPTAGPAGSSTAAGTPAAGAASGTPVTRASRALPGAPRATQLALPLGRNWPTPRTPPGGPRAARPPKAGPSPKATPTKATPSKATPSPKTAPAPMAVPLPRTGPARSAGVTGTSDRVRPGPAARAPRPPRAPAPPLPPAGHSLPPSPPRRRRPRPPDGSGPEK
jgi:hypothetical protein